jgi:hypothetical protein
MPARAGGGDGGRGDDAGQAAPTAGSAEATVIGPTILGGALLIGFPEYRAAIQARPWLLAIVRRLSALAPTNVVIVSETVMINLASCTDGELRMLVATEHWRPPQVPAQAV